MLARPRCPYSWRCWLIAQPPSGNDRFLPLHALQSSKSIICIGLDSHITLRGYHFWFARCKTSVQQSSLRTWISIFKQKRKAATHNRNRAEEALQLKAIFVVRHLNSDYQHKRPFDNRLWWEVVCLAGSIEDFLVIFLNNGKVLEGWGCCSTPCRLNMRLKISTSHSISVSNPLCLLICYTSRRSMLTLIETMRAYLFVLLGWILQRTLEPSLAGDYKFVSSVARRYLTLSQGWNLPEDCKIFLWYMFSFVSRRQLRCLRSMVHVWLICRSATVLKWLTAAFQRLWFAGEREREGVVKAQ